MMTMTKAAISPSAAREEFDSTVAEMDFSSINYTIVNLILRNTNSVLTI